MDSGEVPQFFLCPISLEIMRDPVTTVAGITYDRASIERWLSGPAATSRTCPVTQQPLPRDPSALTPNHTLRRLIQSWCERSAGGVPTPRSPVDRPAVEKILRDLSASAGPRRSDSLELIAALTRQNESNRQCMLQSGAAASLVEIVVASTAGATADESRLDHIRMALGVLQSLGVPSAHLKPLVDGGDRRVLDAMAQVLLLGGRRHHETRSAATVVLKAMVEVASPRTLEQLRPEFFHAVVGVVRGRISQQATRAALKVLVRACTGGRNRRKVVKAGGVREAIELELTMPEKRTTELNLGLLSHLCTTADGRADLVGHPAGIAAVAKRILRVSAAADELGLQILSALCGAAATTEVVQEMLSVGAVVKLCLVMQASCSSSVKEKARAVLRMHSQAWKDAPCIDDYLQSRYR